MSVDRQLLQAQNAIDRGNRAEARRLLEQVVNQDERNEQAWLMLSAIVDLPGEKEICLENAVALNPDNQQAREQLDAIRRGDAESGPLSVPGDPFGDSMSAPGQQQGIDDPFAWLNDALDQQKQAVPPAPPAPRESPAPPAATPPDPFDDPATSVDWGGDDDRPPVYGSGRNIDAPSPAEYDDWVQGLNLNSGESGSVNPESTAPFILDDSAQFGDASSMFEERASFGFDTAEPSSDSDNLFGGSSAAWDEPPFAGNQAGKELADTFGDFGSVEAESGAADDVPFSAEPEELFGASAPEPEASPEVEDEEELDLIYGEEDGFEDDGDEDSGWLDELMPAETAPSAPTLAVGGTAQPAYRAADYYRLIPGEIEAKSGGISWRSWLLASAVALLAALNVVSIALLAF